MKLKADVLRTARQNQRMTARELARAACTTATLIRTVEQTGDASYMPGRVISRIAETLGVPLVMLIDDVGPSRSKATSSDLLVAELIASLFDHRDGVSLAMVAAAGGIELRQVEAVLDDAEHRLTGTGLAVSRTGDVLRIGAQPRSVLTPAKINEAGGRLGRRVRLGRGHFDVLHHTMTGSSAKSLSASMSGRLACRFLVNAGVLIDPDNESEPFGITDDVRFSLVLC